MLRSQILKCQQFPHGIPKNNPCLGHVPGILLSCRQLHIPNTLLLVLQRFKLHEFCFLRAGASSDWSSAGYILWPDVGAQFGVVSESRDRPGIACLADHAL